jgi:WD40 repeat protein
MEWKNESKGSTIYYFLTCGFFFCLFSQVWRKEEAHATGLITDIAFHPFVPWWVASAGEDGAVKVWDLRCGARALVALDEHVCAATRIAWSPTHAEVLATASIDRRVRVWSLNLPPHYLVATRTCDAPVVAAGFPKRALFHACGGTFFFIPFPFPFPYYLTVFTFLFYIILSHNFFPSITVTLYYNVNSCIYNYLY